MKLKSNTVLQVDINEAKGVLLKRSFYKFVKAFWFVNISEEPVWNWHIKELCAELQLIVERLARREAKLEDVICNIPPGTTKSTLFSVMLPAWAWTVDPSLRILVTTYSATLSEDFARYSRNIITSDLYAAYFPYVQISKDQNAISNYTNSKNGQRVSVGLGGTITGKHFHLIIIDDPLNPKQAASKQDCATTNATIDSTLATRKVNKKITVTCMVMQRLNENDPTGHLLSKKGKRVKHICLPAELKDGVLPAKYEAFYVDGLLDPDRLPYDVLEEQLADLGASNYAGQFSQKPAPAKGAIWQRWFIEIEDKVFPKRHMFKQFGNDWDTAFTDKEENAASAYVTTGKINNDIYIDDFNFDWLEFPELLRLMERMEGMHYIENKASGKDLKTMLSRNGINAVLIDVPGDKEARAKMATPPAEAGRVFIRKSLADRLYNDAKQGILKFPRGKYKDVADALAQALIRQNKKGVHVASSNNDDDILNALKNQLQ